VRLRALGSWSAVTLFACLLTSLAFPSLSLAQEELNRKVRTRVAPAYPELARRINLRGTVKLLVVVLPNGNVKDTKVMGGNPILVNAAIDALKKWKFESSPDETSGTIEFKFEPTD
jgi:TonB family protein